MTLTNQQVFDNALNQMRKQNYMRSYNPDLQACVYRGKNGLKCAIGASIPDSLYDPGIEDRTVSELLWSPPFAELFHLVDLCLLQDLQHLHDSKPWDLDESEEVILKDEFEADMMALASKYDLAYTQP